MVFHFNKKHLEDPTIPMWVVKTKGESYYVNHVTCELPWTTKETPDNSHTKGSLKIKKCLLVIDEHNDATITKLTPADEARLTNQKSIFRIITHYGAKLKSALENVDHNDIKLFGGGCSTQWFVTEIYDEELFVLLKLNIADLRILMPNEYYYTEYGNEESDDADEDINWEDLYES